MLDDGDHLALPRSWTESSGGADLTWLLLLSDKEMWLKPRFAEEECRLVQENGGRVLTCLGCSARACGDLMELAWFQDGMQTWKAVVLQAVHPRLGA